jgi:hypothetical protein
VAITTPDRADSGLAEPERKKKKKKKNERINKQLKNDQSQIEKKRLPVIHLDNGRCAGHLISRLPFAVQFY